MTLRIIPLFFLIIAIAGGQRLNCPKTDQHFEKILGLIPSSSSSQNSATLLLKTDNKSVGITQECINRCSQDNDCKSFVIYYNVSTCYQFRNDVAEHDVQINTNSAWFVKNCFKTPCEKLWIFERVPGATLVGNNTKILPKPYTRIECQQLCLNETQFDCRSVKFKIQNPPYGVYGDVQGICTLSDADRHIFPNAFRVSAYDDEYFENQCSKLEKEGKGEFCSFEEYFNSTLSHTDLFYPNKTKDECQELCERVRTFNCRSFSLIGKHLTDCYLHSEDSKIYGPKLLQDNPQGKYFERTPCINITISCTETYMTVFFKPKTSFYGSMYMEGYSEQPECFVKGRGTNPVNLKLSLLTKQCGILKAKAPDERTLLGGTMILQFNPLVQTQGDRVIRVGCIFGNDSRVLAGTGITVSTAPNHASPLLNTTGNVGGPTVEMRVVDALTQEEVSSTQIGQELQLIIEITPPNTTLDIWASHLIAMTAEGDESILLLDDFGCPTNPEIFPSLTKIATNTTKKLVATFQAFKFSSSPIVRFSVLVQFCPKACPPLQCGNASFKLQKRALAQKSVEIFNGTTITTVNRTQFANGTSAQMPLEFIMIVRNPSANSDRLVLSDGKILIAGYDYIAHEVCLDYSLFIGLIVTWILIQIVFVVCCIVMVRRYKKYYENDTTQSLEQLNKNFGFGFSNLDNRRVHWADNEEYT